MKTILLSCALFVGLVMLLAVSAMPIGATDNLSDNLSLVELLPDIEKIYREALTLPYQEAAKHIYDEDIAQFYGLLLQRTGLDIPPDE
ncbi:hypothetical protein ES703_107228 [subsurface metagenome]